ncbi:hypothetical protein AVEN_43100-1 [Araneus ventricosus]|uniref:Mariner Mos1 transposase n=1 Tax=Araneus ventricosus TaxID=182803 RepID=A0A4Y2J7M5_ARAVE|nr:hypothetical protein AVEN_43100-1 [Araneus ventricosus]
MCEGKVRKIMASVFWDRQGILLVDFMQRGTTINAVGWLVWDLLAQEQNLAVLRQTYCESTAYGTINAVAYGQTLRKLCRAIQNKRHGMLTEGILLLHDNARPHTAAQTRTLWTLLAGKFWTIPPTAYRPCDERFSSFPPSQTSSRRQPLQR